MEKKQLNYEASQDYVNDSGLSMWYPKTFGADWSDSPPTEPGWWWFDPGDGNAGLYLLEKRKFKNELFTKVWVKPPYGDKPNHYRSLKRFVGRWSKPSKKLFI